MIGTIISKIFGNKSAKDIKRLKPKIQQINDYYKNLKSLSDEKLIKKYQDLKTTLSSKIIQKKKDLNLLTQQLYCTNAIIGVTERRVLCLRVSFKMLLNSCRYSIKCLV